MKYRSGLLETLEVQYKGKISKEFLKERIAKIFSDKNFYFYQIRHNEAEIKKEWEQMEQFVSDNIKQPRFYIEKGLLEPVHLSPNESDILIEGM